MVEREYGRGGWVGIGTPHPHHMQLHNMLIIRHIYKILTLSGTFFGTLLA